MITLDNIRNLDLSITWRLLYIGIIDQQISTKDVIAYASEKLQEGDGRSQICELATAYATERDYICNLLWELIQQENTQEDFENRKIRATIVSNTLKNKVDNCIDGLMILTDLWCELGYPVESPHVIQGVDNHITPEEYYTVENYNLLYEKNLEWLKKELFYLRKNNNI